MIMKAKIPFRPPISKSVTHSPPWTTAERLQRIEAMGQRINVYVQFMCQVGTLKGSSAEATEKAVSAFYEEMVVLERQLGAIHDAFKLE
jgi:hypothetical protein